MIFGVGTDICDVRRVRASLDRHGSRLANKILGPAEYTTWQSRSTVCPERGVRYLASRFSAKEAFGKAAGLGIRPPMSWHLCEISHRASGQPCVVLHGGLRDWFDAQGLRAHISLSDEADYAVSYCVLEFLDGHGQHSP